MIPYKTDTDISSYIIFPRFLIPLDLSNDAKVLYVLLLDRAGISRKKGYIEWNHPPILYCGGCQSETSPKQAGGNTGVSRTGILRFNLPPETGPWQTGCDHLESAGWRKERRQ